MKLNKNTVLSIIQLAEKVGANRINVKEMEAREFLEKTSDPASPRVMLEDAIKKLTPDERYELVALFWLGRGDAENWGDLMSQAKAQDLGKIAGYLSAKTTLASNLSAGLDKLP